MSIFTVFLLILAANICLCLSFDQHFKQVMEKRLASPLKQRLRIAGYALLSISLAAAFATESYLGLVYWCGQFSLIALPAPYILAYLSRATRSTR